jgi:hypothetical protein
MDISFNQSLRGNTVRSFLRFKKTPLLQNLESFFYIPAYFKQSIAAFHNTGATLASQLFYHLN